MNIVRIIYKYAAAQAASINKDLIVDAVIDVFTFSISPTEELAPFSSTARFEGSSIVRYQMSDHLFLGSTLPVGE